MSRSAARRALPQADVLRLTEACFRGGSISSDASTPITRARSARAPRSNAGAAAQVPITHSSPSRLRQRAGRNRAEGSRAAVPARRRREKLCGRLAPMRGTRARAGRSSITPARRELAARDLPSAFDRRARCVYPARAGRATRPGRHPRPSSGARHGRLQLEDRAQLETVSSFRFQHEAASGSASDQQRGESIRSGAARSPPYLHIRTGMFSKAKRARCTMRARRIGRDARAAESIAGGRRCQPAAA